MTYLGGVRVPAGLAQMMMGMGGDDHTPVLYSPKKYVDWTGMRYLTDGERRDLGMLVTDESVVALVASKQISYSDAMSYSDVNDGVCHLFIQGDKNVTNGAVKITVGTLDLLSYLTCLDTLPTQVVWGCSFPVDKNNIGKLDTEFGKLGYELVPEELNLNGLNLKWSFLLVDKEDDVIIGQIGPLKPDAEEVPDDISGLMRMMGRREKAVDKLWLNLSTDDTVMVKAITQYFCNLQNGNEEAKFVTVG